MPAADSPRSPPVASPRSRRRPRSSQRRRGFPPGNKPLASQVKAPTQHPIPICDPCSPRGARGAPTHGHSVRLPTAAEPDARWPRASPAQRRAGARVGPGGIPGLPLTMRPGAGTRERVPRTRLSCPSACLTWPARLAAVISPRPGQPSPAASCMAAGAATGGGACARHLPQRRSPGFPGRGSLTRRDRSSRARVWTGRLDQLRDPPRPGNWRPTLLLRVATDATPRRPRAPSRAPAGMTVVRAPASQSPRRPSPLRSFGAVPPPSPRSTPRAGPRPPSTRIVLAAFHRPLPSAACPYQRIIPISRVGGSSIWPARKSCTRLAPCAVLSCHGAQSGATTSPCSDRARVWARESRPVWCARHGRIPRPIHLAIPSTCASDPRPPRVVQSQQPRGESRRPLATRAAPADTSPRHSRAAHGFRVDDRGLRCAPPRRQRQSRGAWSAESLYPPGRSPGRSSAAFERASRSEVRFARAILLLRGPPLHPLASDSQDGSTDQSRTAAP